ncbi:glycosyltransferase [Aeromicrobium chenweiae]|uniref:Glycosyl transferase family 1 n=1 Tax=Aeromicrobium chenweiae TaxID=2079793 RepID=A0A2S0WIM8_9ACTN|nr:glycosyltransferase [Aeromicrobium chenweiae]AWB91196.1 glycosyl transferase family 1 [Aeromicrobium chenweiae]TGN31714.1 glycosyltransferase [Aeromicrobium chenweiae]
MKLLVAGEYRLHRAPDGRVHADSVFGAPFWERYLQAFDEVVVLARVDDRDHGSGVPVEGPGVRVHPLPYYEGVAGLARTYPRLRRAIHEAAAGSEAVLLRAPGPISSLLHRGLASGRPYAVELVGDPHEVLSSMGPVAGLAGRRVAGRLAEITRGAEVVAYVSSQVLPDRYPADDRAMVTFYSSATLPEAAYVDRAGPPTGPPNLVCVGSMEQEYKGIDVVLRAVASLRPDEFGTLAVLGDGRHRPAYEQLAHASGIADRVRFLGHLDDRQDVWAQLDAADVFVSGSRTEGLPRAMIEAMARGLPAVGTDVGGTPELLPSWAMCPADDAGALAGLVRRCADPGFRQALAVHCRERARDYAQPILDARRRAAYERLRDATAEWSGVAQG